MFSVFRAEENDPEERKKLLMPEEGLTKRTTKSLIKQRAGIQGTVEELDWGRAEKLSLWKQEMDAGTPGSDWAMGR